MLEKGDMGGNALVPFNSERPWNVQDVWQCSLTFCGVFIDRLNTSLENKTKVENRTEDDPSLLRMYSANKLQTTHRNLMKKLVKNFGQIWAVDALSVSKINPFTSSGSLVIKSSQNILPICQFIDHHFEIQPCNFSFSSRN